MNDRDERQPDSGNAPDAAARIRRVRIAVGLLLAALIVAALVWFIAENSAIPEKREPWFGLRAERAETDPPRMARLFHWEGAVRHPIINDDQEEDLL